MNYNIQNYIFDKVIGKGVYGEVYLGNKKNGYFQDEFELLAIKRINDEPRFKRCAIKEIELLKKMNSPGCENVIKLLDDFEDKNIIFSL